MGNVAVLALVAWIPVSGAYQLSMGTAECRAGQEVLIPVLLDDAAGLASLELQINYDASLLQYVACETAETIGSGFVVHAVGVDGCVVVTLARSEPLASGAGTLLQLRMRANVGAAPGMYTSLTVAHQTLGGGLGKELAWSAPVRQENGRLWIVASDAVDSDGDGLSDYAEQERNGSPDYNPYDAARNPKGTDTKFDDPDSDGDGLSDGYEWTVGSALGGPPSRPFELGGNGVFPAIERVPGGVILRWNGHAGHRYAVLRGTDLAGDDFTPLPGAAALPGREGVNAYTNGTSGTIGPLFYKIGVRRAP